jgi:hypothetical protein
MKETAKEGKIVKGFLCEATKYVCQFSPQPLLSSSKPTSSKICTRQTEERKKRIKEKREDS